jgi:predicted transcriptional regulator
VYGIAIFKGICYIRTERRLKKLEKDINDWPQKLQQIIKEANEHRHIQ